MPRGDVARTPEECRQIAAKLNGPVAVKAQVWTTGRARYGGIQFAGTPEEAARLGCEIFTAGVGGGKVEEVLIEERLSIEREFYASLTIDDALRRPVLLLGISGGTGVEERAILRPGTMTKLPVSVREEPSPADLAEAVRRIEAPSDLQARLGEVLLHLYRVARNAEARVAEINPLAQTSDGRLVALDCRISIDDYAVFRHPDLNIEVARELGHPPSELEKEAWQVEKDDYRGTFYFVELSANRDRPGHLVGFHGAGGGGSMASLDAAIRQGLSPANYTDTSGNPAPSKVYRAARLILSQPGIQGYFLSGSGVASQEQYHLARALVKAFREERPAIPAVLRLGGNGEERAGRIIREYTADLPAPVEAYQKIHSADFCAQRLRQLIDERRDLPDAPDQPRSEVAVRNPARPYTFETRTGRITYDHAVCLNCESKACVKECEPQILRLEGDLPVLNVSREDARRGKCTECLACEVECWFQGEGGGLIELPIPGLEKDRG